MRMLEVGPASSVCRLCWRASHPVCTARRMIRLIFTFVLLLSSWAEAETVDVKYRGPVDLKPFTC